MGFEQCRNKKFVCANLRSVERQYEWEVILNFDKV